MKMKSAEITRYDEIETFDTLVRDNFYKDAHNALPKEINSRYACLAILVVAMEKYVGRQRFVGLGDRALYETCLREFDELKQELAPKPLKVSEAAQQLEEMVA